MAFCVPIMRRFLKDNSTHNDLLTRLVIPTDIYFHFFLYVVVSSNRELYDNKDLHFSKCAIHSLYLVYFLYFTNKLYCPYNKLT